MHCISIAPNKGSVFTCYVIFISKRLSTFFSDFKFEARLFYCKSRPLFLTLYNLLYERKKIRTLLYKTWGIYIIYQGQVGTYFLFCTACNDVLCMQALGVTAAAS